MEAVVGLGGDSSKGQRLWGPCHLSHKVRVPAYYEYSNHASGVRTGPLLELWRWRVIFDPLHPFGLCAFKIVASK